MVDSGPMPPITPSVFMRRPRVLYPSILGQVIGNVALRGRKLAGHRPLQLSYERMKAIQLKKTGGPEALEFVEIPVPQPKSGEAVVKVAASGVNFIDVYHR